MGAALTIALVVADMPAVLRLDEVVAERLHATALQHPALLRTSRIVTDWVVDPWTLRLLLAAAVVWLWQSPGRAGQQGPHRQDPHPPSPDTPPGNKLLGPGAGLVDRARGLLTGRGKDRASTPTRG